MANPFVWWSNGLASLQCATPPSLPRDHEQLADVSPYYWVSRTGGETDKETPPCDGSPIASATDH